jgi:hypothetical protein
MLNQFFYWSMLRYYVQSMLSRWKSRGRPVDAKESVKEKIEARSVRGEVFHTRLAHLDEEQKGKD